MAGYLVVLCFAVFICQVHSQYCSPPILPPPCPAPSLPPCPVPCLPPSPPIIPPCPTTQVINPNPYVTTIIDTSVSSGLVNALQLLIVSNLIGSTLGPSGPLVDSLGPLLDSLLCQNSCPVEVVIPEYFPCGPGYDLIPPYYPITCGSYYDFIPPISPISPYAPCYEPFPPCGPIFDPYTPPFCGLTDIISPNFISYTETITPICFDPYNPYNDMVLPIGGIDTSFYGLADIIPNYINYPIPEICPYNPYYPGIVEPLAPAVLPVYGCLNELVAPLPIANPSIYPETLGLAALTPNYYGGIPELTVPVPGEVLYPSPIQTPVCNYGFSPSTLPCVKLNMDSYDNCLYNGYPGPIYY